jgi:hypothetical protein
LVEEDGLLSQMFFKERIRGTTELKNIAAVAPSSGHPWSPNLNFFFTIERNNVMLKQNS